MEKSQFLLQNTSPLVERNIMRILGFSKGYFPSKYLGPPLGDGPSKLILVKVVLQGMPLYLFSILATLKSVIKEIRSIQRNFLWGGREAKSKFTLVWWGKIYCHKLIGGLGIRDPKVMRKVQ